MTEYLLLMMASFLQRPFPPFADSRRSGWAAFFAALIVFAILFLGEPFQLDTVPLNTKFTLSLAYAAATLLVSTLFLVLLPFFFPSLFDSRRWKVSKEILFFCILLACISVVNAWVNAIANQIPFTMGMLFRMTGNTLLVGIVPVALSIFVKQQVLLRHYQQGAIAINEAVAEKTNQHVNSIPDTLASPSATSLLLTGDNQGETLNLLPAQWMAAEANDNYVRIFFDQPTGEGSVLFRTTLKKMEAQLQGHAGIYRCHKSFLVNLQKVSHLSGNAQGYRLHLVNSELQIPVSRSLNSELKEKLKNSLH
jgi:hypothetical protein